MGRLSTAKLIFGVLRDSVSHYSLLLQIDFAQFFTLAIISNHSQPLEEIFGKTSLSNRILSNNPVILTKPFALCEALTISSDSHRGVDFLP